MNESLSLGRIAGIHVGLNWSLLVVIALIAWSLAVGTFPNEASGQPAAAYWVAGIVAAIIFFASLLAHELAHSLVAQRRGVRVEGITLWLFGGVSRLSGDAHTAQAEAWITFVGPLTSIVIGVVFLLLGLVLSGAHAPSLAVATVSWIGGINLILAVFNLLPAFPLDGGRVLRSLIWARTGDRVRATDIAARIGMGFAFLMIAFGIFEFLALGNLVGGIWFVFLGWFLLGAARAEQSGGLLREALDGVRVADVMTPNPIQAPDYITVDELLNRYVFAHRHGTFPTQDVEGRITGLVTLPAIKRVPTEARVSTHVRDIMCPLDDVPRASPDESLIALLGRLGGCSEGRALVLGPAGTLVGIVSPSDVSRLMQLSSAGRGGAVSPAGVRSP